MGFPNSYAFIWDIKNVVSVTFNVLFPWPGKRTFLQMKDFEISPLQCNRHDISSLHALVNIAKMDPFL